MTAAISALIPEQYSTGDLIADALLVAFIISVVLYIWAEEAAGPS